MKKLLTLISIFPFIAMSCGREEGKIEEVKPEFNSANLLHGTKGIETYGGIPGTLDRSGNYTTDWPDYSRRMFGEFSDRKKYMIKDFIEKQRITYTEVSENDPLLLQNNYLGQNDLTKPHYIGTPRADIRGIFSSDRFSKIYYGNTMGIGTRTEWYSYGWMGRIPGVENLENFEDALYGDNLEKIDEELGRIEIQSGARLEYYPQQFNQIAPYPIGVQHVFDGDNYHRSRMGDNDLFLFKTTDQENMYPQHTLGRVNQLNSVNKLIIGESIGKSDGCGSRPEYTNDIVQYNLQFLKPDTYYLLTIDSVIDVGKNIDPDYKYHFQFPWMAEEVGMKRDEIKYIDSVAEYFKGEESIFHGIGKTIRSLRERTRASRYIPHTELDLTNNKILGASQEYWISPPISHLCKYEDMNGDPLKEHNGEKNEGHLVTEISTFALNDRDENMIPDARFPRRIAGHPIW